MKPFISKQQAWPFFRTFISYIIYIFTALMACFFALMIVLNFLNPALSKETEKQKSQQEKLTAKKVFKDIFKNLKVIAKDSFSGDSKSAENSDSSQPLEGPKGGEYSKRGLESSCLFS